MTWKQLSRNEDYGALINSARIHAQTDSDRQSWRMTVRKMYDADKNEGIGLMWMIDHTLFQCGNVFWYEYLWRLWYYSIVDLILETSYKRFLRIFVSNY